MRLAGKRALVTAAGAGIGRASALAFAREGAAVTATDIDEAALTSLAVEDARIEVARLDVLDRAAVAGLGERPAFDVVMACAGFVHHGTLLDCDDAAWDFSMDLNVGALARLLRAVLPGMLANGGGSVVAVASAASSIKGVPARAVYSSSKAAVIGLVKSVAADFIGQGIRANAICPGTIDTPSLGGRIAATGDAVAARAAFVARQPLGRLGTADEVAALAVYLASDESGFTTGAVHVIDGGWTM